jgi:hypothetical protein
LKDGHGDSAEDALKQIDEKGYMLPFSASGNKFIKIGAVFDAGQRTIGEWMMSEQEA